jgi:hypothetical protein
MNATFSAAKTDSAAASSGTRGEVLRGMANPGGAFGHYSIIERGKD